MGKNCRQKREYGEKATDDSRNCSTYENKRKWHKTSLEKYTTEKKTSKKPLKKTKRKMDGRKLSWNRRIKY